MKVRTIISILVFSLVIILHADTADAFPVTWEFSGEVTTVFDSENLLGGSVVEGSALTGSFTFESGSTPLNPPGGGYYDNSVSNVIGNFDGFSFAGPEGENHIFVSNDSFSDNSDGFSIFSEVDGLSRILQFSLGIRDPSGTMFTSSDLPLYPPTFSLLDPELRGFSLGIESETLSIRGTITTLVPEPGTIVLFGIVSCVVLRRKKHKKKSCFQVVVVLLLLQGFVLVDSSLAQQDCNLNGIEDSLELSTCPAIDIVFLIDTSNSESTDIDDFCRVITDPGGVIDGLQQEGLTINSEILRIGVEGGVCTCCVGTVPNVYGVTTDCLPDVLGTCDPGTSDQGNSEDWGPATAIVAAEKTWGPGPRVIVPTMQHTLNFNRHSIQSGAIIVKSTGDVK